MTDSRPVLEQYNELLGILGRFTQHNMNMDESIKVSCIIDKLPPLWKDFKHTLKHLKEELTLIELGSHLRIKKSLRAQDNDKLKGNNVAGPSVVNMVEYNNSSRYNDNKGKRKHHDTRANPNKKPKVTCWKCGKPGHLKKDCKGGNIGNRANRSSTKGFKDGSSNPLKGQNAGSRESLNDGSILHMGNESTTLVHGRGCVDLSFSSGKVVSLLNLLHVPNIRKNLVSCSVLNNCGYKHVIESNKFVLSKHGVFIGFGYLSNHMFRLNIVSDNIGSAFMSTSKLNDSILWHARLGHVHFKRIQDMSKDGLIPTFEMDTKKCQTCMLNKITKKPFQNVKRETKVLELIHSDLCDLHATPSLGNKKYFVTFIDDASRFYVIKPNDSVAINSIIESRDAIFDEHRFSSDPRPSQRSLGKGTDGSGGSVVSERVTDEIVQQSEPRKSKRHRTPKDFGPEFQLYLVEGTRDEVSDQHSYCFNVEDDPKIFDEAMKPLGCKWIFKRKLKVDGTVEKFKTSLIIHQMDVKTTFLNEELEEEVYMNQPLGFILPGNENKVCKLVKSLYGLKQAPKQWHQKFDEVVLSNGYSLNQADKCVYSKFDASGKGVIICLYVDDMLIFGTDQVLVDLTVNTIHPYNTRSGGLVK
ncbi:zinc finger, CCHC-type containing protein [Tanacetum coccineum]